MGEEGKGPDSKQNIKERGKRDLFGFCLLIYSL